MIKRSLYLAVVLVLFLPPLHASAAGKPGTGTETAVTALEGTAQAFPKGGASGRALKKGDRIGKNMEVRVGERSRLELRFPDGTVMRLSERSRLAMDQVLYTAGTEQKKVKVNLSSGKLWAKVKKLMTGDSTVEVRTTNAVAGVRGTVYRVNVNEDLSATIKVYDGSVYVANPPRDAAQTAAPGAPHEVPGPHEVPPPYHEVTLEEWTAIVQAMQQISISPEGVPTKPESFDPKADSDDWVRWNQSRDKQLHF